MISKLAVHGRDRAEAIDRMHRALMEYEVGGIKTTLPFFRELMEDEQFRAGNLDTGFIPRFIERRKPKAVDETTRDMAIIAAALSFRKAISLSSDTADSQPKPSRWAMSARRSMPNSK